MEDYSKLTTEELLDELQAKRDCYNLGVSRRDGKILSQEITAIRSELAKHGIKA